MLMFYKNHIQNLKRSITIRKQLIRESQERQWRARYDTSFEYNVGEEIANDWLINEYYSKLEKILVLNQKTLPVDKW